MRVSRRDFLKRAAATTGVLLLITILTRFIDPSSSGLGLTAHFYGPIQTLSARTVPSG